MTSIMTTELLDFEEQWPRWSGRKDEAIRARFGIPPARYFQILNRVIDTREALELRPMLVRRLRRRRDAGAAEQRRRHAV
ncbi:MAG: DUF3263 domain-containing protein [Microbacterium sp.]|uniref:DUF3263 domain-containing protein n=1 Tax=unclassified Microbacterium TaxID=2609290 RepID=UPI001AC33807|nr:MULTISPECIES: DUF3263 domain-containing protein [unclassified Microbacterium]MBN9210892.1 DUF3263 domain-containing protein [Microbacterium sp.]